MSELHPKANWFLQLIIQTSKKTESLYLAFETYLLLLLITSNLPLNFHLSLNMVVSGRKWREVVKLFLTTPFTVASGCKLHTFYPLGWPLRTLILITLTDIVHHTGLPADWQSCSWHGPPGRHSWISLTCLFPLPITLWESESLSNTADIQDGTRLALKKDIHHRTTEFMPFILLGAEIKIVKR